MDKKTHSKSSGGSQRLTQKMLSSAAAPAHSRDLHLGSYGGPVATQQFATHNGANDLHGSGGGGTALSMQCGYNAAAAAAGYLNAASSAGNRRCGTPQANLLTAATQATHPPRIAGGAVAETSTTNKITSSQHHHQQQHHQHQSSHHHSNNNNNNIQNKPTHHPNYYNNNNNTSSHNNNNTNNKIVNPSAAVVKTAAPAEHMAVTPAKTTVTTLKTATSMRSKNEEAINDLRTRIPEIENIFDVHLRIGNGTFSTVLLGTLKKERDLPEAMKRKFAIKHHIPTSHPDRIMKELQCMAKIGGTDNVVGINCCIRYNESVAFIMPYMPHDRFHDFFNKMDLSELQFYMKNLLIALRHVHKFNVIHRDVKPSNFLYNRRNREFLLVDFGLAQQVPAATQTQQVGSSSQQILALKAGIHPAAVEGGKRPRDANDGEVTSKRQKYSTSGSHGDQHQQQQQQQHTASTSNARLTNSCLPNGTQSPFKMPLKQLNEISGKNGGGSGNVVLDSGTTPGGCSITVPHNSAATTGGGSSIYDVPLNGRQVRSMAGGIGTVVGAANQVRVRGGQAPSAGGGVMPTSSAKYNTNRGGGHDSKCYCYGHPQVCNICLVKKEIHASRAGTPGYRPPEVLLKYPDQTTAVDIWAAGVIFLSILSSVYPFFKAPNDFVALAEMVTIFGDKTIRKTAFALDRLLTLSQKTKPLDLRKLCVRFRNRTKFSSPDLLRKYQDEQGHCEVCKNCDQFFFNCLCLDTQYETEPLEEDDPFPDSAYDLLYRLLEVNPHERITAHEALEHPFFTDHWVKGQKKEASAIPPGGGAAKEMHPPPPSGAAN